MAQVSLRDLVQKYTRGEIGKDEYRKTRTDLIKDVLAREHTLRTNTFPPLIKPGDEGTLDITERSQKKDGVKSQAAAAAEENAATSGSRPLNPLYIAAALILVIIAVIAVILLLPDHAPEQQATVQEPPKLQAPAGISTQAKTLIQEFLQNNKWDNDSLDTFLRAWTALSETDQRSIKGSMVLNRLTNAIYNRLLEERAIIGLDTTASETSADINKQDRLVFFARQLGINDDRIRIQTAANPAPQPTVAQAETAPVVAPGPSEPNPAAETATPPVTEPVSAAVNQPEAGETANPPPKQEAVVNTVPNVPAEKPVTAAQAPKPITARPEPTPGKPAPAKPATQSGTAPPAVTSTASEQQQSGNCNPSLLKSRRPYCRDIIPGIGNGPTMVIIPPGKFAMGGARPDEQPVHNVVISKPFAMSVHEITNGEYQLFCKNTNKKCPEQPWSGDDYPVVNISWYDATAYTEWLSARTGQRYRLPSESQWEYAARGGTRTIYPFGDTIDMSYAVFSDRNTLSSPLPKTDRSINRNKFRLYHIVGNVREWVADTWVENYKGAPTDGSPRLDGDKSMRIARGGSYKDNAEALRSAARKSLPADTTDSYTGFRVIQELD